MPRRSKLPALTIVAVVAAAIWAACNGGEFQFTATVEPGQVTCDPLRQIKTYRYDVSVTIDLAARPLGAPPENPDRGASAFKLTTAIENGEVENPDRIRAVVKVPESASETQVIMVGDRYWTLLEGEWLPGTVQPGLEPGVPFLPIDVCNALAPDIDVSGMTGQPERVGDIEASKYHFDSLPTDFSSRLLGPQSDMALLIKEYQADIWVAEEGKFIAKLDMVGVGTYANGRKLTVKAALEIKDINANIKIEPPVQS